MRRSIIVLFVLLTFLFCCLSAFADTGIVNVSVVSTNMDTGVIGLKYSSGDSLKVKLVIEKEGIKYLYNLKNNKSECFPFQLGNGKYKVSVLQNIDGNSYKYAYTGYFNNELEDENDVYLNPIQNIFWDESGELPQLAKYLTRNSDNDMERIKAVYNYVITNFKYDYSKLKTLTSDYLPNNEAFLNSKKGICYDFASFYAALLRSLQIPTKLAMGYTSNVKGYHAWNEVYNRDTGKWIVIDTTCDAVAKSAKMNYRMEKKKDIYNKVKEY